MSFKQRVPALRLGFHVEAELDGDRGGYVWTLSIC